MAAKFLVAGAFAAATMLGGSGALGASNDLVKRGEYLARIMVCGDCHSPLGDNGAADPERHLHGASVGWELPGTGVFFPPNLTPDPETGLGNWSDDEIITALRTGERPDGRTLVPIMPWLYYSGLSDDDAAALVAYLRSLPPVTNAVPGPFGSGQQVTVPYFTIKNPE